MASYNPPARGPSRVDEPHKRLNDPLSALENALVAASDAYNRWVAEGMGAAGQKGLSALEIAFVLDLMDSAPQRTFLDLCQARNVEEPYLAHYALRKLRDLGLVETGRRGKEKTVTLTEKGQDLCRNFSDLRGRIIGPDSLAGVGQAEIAGMSDLLRQIAAVYDQAKHAARAC